jgi:hypothetical protein
VVAYDRDEVVEGLLKFHLEKLSFDSNRQGLVSRTGLAETNSESGFLELLAGSTNKIDSLDNVYSRIVHRV